MYRWFCELACEGGDGGRVVFLRWLDVVGEVHWVHVLLGGLRRLAELFGVRAWGAS